MTAVATHVSKDQSNTDRATVIAGPESEGRERPPCLIVVSGVFLGQQLDIADDPVVIGRAAEATLSLQHPSVSRSHCKVWQDGEHFFIEDLGSTNKTYLNGQAVMRAELSDGDQIGVGNHALKFFRGASPEARYHQELIDLAVHDSLTGFYNRRHFRMLLDEQVERARGGEPLAVLIVDLDHFKQINDHFGHLVGDQVIASVSQLIREHSDSGCALGRLGGEEFAVALPDTAHHDARAVAERIRAKIALHRFEVHGESQQISTSVGVASWEPSMHGSADLLRKADERLYLAKANGRNRVESE
jgi:diguanylate cyclase (GGDEF)-like protein